MDRKKIYDLSFDLSHTEELSPHIFGHNLEHTRAAVYGGLSAQMLRNRKFAGKPSKNEDVTPHSFFEESLPEVTEENGAYEITMPPHSAAMVKLRCRK